MIFTYIQLCVIALIIVVVILVVGSLLWSSNSQTNDSSTQSYLGFKEIRDIMIEDSYLHRLLMIEIINEKSNDAPSEIVTYNKMIEGTNLLGKTLIKYFGGAISQRIATLMQNRNEIIRDYYHMMRSVVCQNGSCVHIINVSEETNASKQVIRPIFPTSNIDGSIESLDITTITLRKLESITNEITDTVAASFQIRDVNQTNHKRPLIHYQRLFNLLSMYDKELINQAKSYTSKHYDISMNCAQSSLEITHHISDELNILMKESQQILRISP